MEEDPIVSQYEAHLHRSTDLTKSTNGQTSELPAEPVLATPLVPPPIHVTPVHTTPNDMSPEHTEPVHTSSEHILLLNHDHLSKTHFLHEFATPTSQRPASVIYDTSAHLTAPH